MALGQDGKQGAARCFQVDVADVVPVAAGGNWLRTCRAMSGFEHVGAMNGFEWLARHRTIKKMSALHRPDI